MRRRPALVPEDLPKLTAAERLAADRAAQLRRQEEEHAARIAEVIDTFGGAADAAGTMARMADELLYCRWVMQDIIAFMEKIQAEEPFAIVGAGSHWEPPAIRRWWFR